MRTDIRDARRAKGLTQVQLAALLGIQQGDVSKVEKGRMRISVEKAPKWSEAVGLDIVTLLYPPQQSDDQAA
jgi:transcriptional regulator with XRE-family HTH domain